LQFCFFSVIARRESRSFGTNDVAIPCQLSRIINKIYSVYIATNHPRNTVLYTGVTNNIFERNFQHQSKINKNSFTAKYNVNRVVYYESFDYVNDAIAREKQIKKYSRKNKNTLINSINLEWKDLIEESYA